MVISSLMPVRNSKTAASDKTLRGGRGLPPYPNKSVSAAFVPEMPRAVCSQSPFARIACISRASSTRPACHKSNTRTQVRGVTFAPPAITPVAPETRAAVETRLSLPVSPQVNFVPATFGWWDTRLNRPESISRPADTAGKLYRMMGIGD
ncbi:dihydrodipicolinate synthetase family protein [Colletotrichum scovillei]|uniref:Dihydrodipicolinate synthetase family protein n=1 Tax=Colletotrichum scovillei TaxID=1209932 RepID=A0A9P7UEP1_9PEZI|nr:dihydrodipicolinate synthetase family protein [Colletotrichum scovillei]KAG7068868.1 dihydrodipicolinate synthetase family protein [Colletotrichum scovillei]KAG7072824.1 dihydrodipicolinate synthetase family protein [Colletotrichum scovillei]